MSIIDRAPAISKFWNFLRTYVLTLLCFDSFLQGALTIVILLEHSVYLLLNRDADTGYSPPLIENWVTIGTGGVQFLLGAFVAWWGRGKRHFALSAWLAVAAVSGLMVLAFPFKRPNLKIVGLCGGGQVTPFSQDLNEPDPLVTPRTVFLIITAVACALTQVSIWAHGLTYLDDHEPRSGPHFYGILIGIRVTLGLSKQSVLHAVSLREDWWKAHLSVCMLTLMFAGLFMLFPKKMDRSEALVEQKEGNSFFSSVGRILSNKSLVLQLGAVGLMNAGVFGFLFYDPEFLQALYHVEVVREDLRTPKLITYIFRPLLVIFFLAIFRFRFTDRHSDGVKAKTASLVGGVAAAFVPVFFVVLASLNCGVGTVAGMESGTFEHPACSNDCGCNSQQYGFAPVCALDTTTTYFSPCHAGCPQYDDLNGFLVFNNCTCTPGPTVRGACALPSCNIVFTIYQVFFSIILSIAGASLLMQGMVFLRAVQRRDKPVAVGVMMASVALIGNVLGHLLYMLISHLTCAFSKEGKCLFHHTTLYSMAAVSAAMTLCSALASIYPNKFASKRVEHDGVGDMDLR